MSDMRLRARPMKWDDIARVAGSHRQKLGVADREYLPVVDLVERVLAQELNLFEFLIGTPEEMGINYGLTHPHGDFIMLRDDVYLGACNDEPRARWTVAHEWGHWALHVGQPLARASNYAEVRPFECPERQAHQFAAELLMPRHLIRTDDTIHSLMRRFVVSHEAAERRIAFLQGRGLILK